LCLEVDGFRDRVELILENCLYVLCTTREVLGSGVELACRTRGNGMREWAVEVVGS
jgi:hypothetical protein